MMETKKLAVMVAAMAAMAATTAVPAFAQEEAAPPAAPSGQYAPSGLTQQQEEEAEDCILPSYPAQPCPPQGAGAGQYDDGSGGGVVSASAEEVAITGEFVTKEGGWSFVVDEKTGQDYYLAGSFDPEGLAGKRVVARGMTECSYDGPVYGCTLALSGIEPVAAEEATPDEQVPPVEVTTAAVDEASGGTEGTAVVSGDTSNANNKGGSGSADVGANSSSGASESASANTSGSAGQGGASLSAKALPSTGGVLPIAGLAGLVLLAAGLLFRRISR